MSRPQIFSPRAFTLLETVAVIAIIALLGGTILPLVFQNLTSKRGEITEDKLLEFKRAIIGNPFVASDEVRTSFGYVGDMGIGTGGTLIPASLEGLYIRGTQPDYDYNSTLKTGAGWQGPYLNLAALQDLNLLSVDAYKQAFVYSTTPSTDPQTGAQIVGQITSLGPNRSMGGNDNRTINIYQSEVFSTVSGFLKDPAGNPLPDVKVNMYYPTNGLLPLSRPGDPPLPSYVTDPSTGFFSFSNVPYGNRTITVEPKLVYADGSAVAGDFRDKENDTPSDADFDDNDGIPDDIILYFTNLSPNSITIRTIKAFFDLGVGGNEKYDEMIVFGPDEEKSGKETGGRRSGASVKFDSTNIAGSGDTTGQTYPIRVQSPQTHIPELRIRDYPAGATVKLELTNFWANLKGKDKSINVKGIPLMLKFYDTWPPSEPPVSTIVIPYVN